jgi:transposase
MGSVANHLKMADQQRIHALLELGWSHRRIAREAGVDRETVARYARLGRSNPANLIVGEKPSSWGPRSPAADHDAVIRQSVKAGLSAQRIWQDLVEQYGYGHGYLTVQRYVKRLKRRGEVADHLEHPPGEEAQVDFFKSPAPVWDAVSGRWRRPWVFRMTLSCSRHGYEEAVWSQERGGFLRAHEHAFMAFGGVPRVVRHDNLKAAVVRACLYDPDLSEVYEAFARHWGFVALPSRPRHPQEQGVQERSGGYVKNNALKGRRFESLEELNRHLVQWNRTVAQLRIHGTTRRQVLAHFLEVEKPALQPLPVERFELFQVGTRTVHMDGYVEVDGAFYTAPAHLIGQRVRVRWDERLVRIYHQGQAVRVHLKRAAGSWSTNPQDRPDHKPARQQAYQALLLAKAERIGERALAWSRAAVEERDVRAYRLLQGMIALTRGHPRERVDWACGVALGSRAFRYRTLRRLVEQAAAREGQPTSRLTQQHDLIRSLDEYGQLVANHGGVA